jgi:hypothetical protein
MSVKRVFVNKSSELRGWVWFVIVWMVFFGILSWIGYGDVTMTGTYCTPSNECSYVIEGGNYKNCPQIIDAGFLTHNNLKLKDGTCKIEANQ